MRTNSFYQRSSSSPLNQDQLFCTVVKCLWWIQCFDPHHSLYGRFHQTLQTLQRLLFCSCFVSLSDRLGDIYDDHDETRLCWHRTVSTGCRLFDSFLTLRHEKCSNCLQPEFSFCCECWSLSLYNSSVRVIHRDSSCHDPSFSFTSLPIKTTATRRLAKWLLVLFQLCLN